MALLTTEDIVNKKFQPTKFREGYDQDEVDDFLDEVVKTLEAVQGENKTLREQLDEANRRIQELSSGAPAPSAPANVEAPAPQSEPIPVTPIPAQNAAPAQSQDEPESATTMLALAQRLHDEYVRNGQEEGERIIAQARVEADKIIKDAEQQHSRILTQLEQDRSLLERKIEELRTYEAEYRAKMREFLEGILSDLANTAEASA